ncbi:MAG: CcdB family protein [Campylobacterota bacterium]|nr:CcdB family protein [Campylobacterota bacterium]
MAQFDLYKNSRENADVFPYLLDVTHEINSFSKLRVVVPLCNDGHAVTHLNPSFNIEGEKLYMSTMDIAGIPATMLVEAVENFEHRRTEIVDALDFLVNGF